MPRPRSEPIRWTTSMDKQQGRDELRTGEMWNSNSLISWLLARAGIDTDGLEPPVGGRAPGWNAGVVVAGRQMQHTEHLEERSRDRPPPPHLMPAAGSPMASPPQQRGHDGGLQDRDPSQARGCPLRSGCSWPGCGPDVAPPTRLSGGELKAVGGHRPRRVAPPRGPFSLAATLPSVLRCPPRPGRFRLGPARAALPRRHRATA
jgi:hypothetical protein